MANRSRVTPVIVRPLEIQDSKAKATFERLESFLGTSNIKERIKSIELEMKSEKGTYLQQWVLANRSWWLGFFEARDKIAKGQSLRGEVTRSMMLPLKTATQISTLFTSMPEATKKEYQNRILADDDIEPTLVELTTATHFWEHGYEIDWAKPEGEGIRSPEFVAKLGDHRIQVECKTKSSDAGRSIKRRDFYRLLDKLKEVLDQKHLMGSIRIIAPGKSSSATAWSESIVNSIADQIHVGQYTVNVESLDDVQISFDLKEGDDVEITPKEIRERQLSLQSRYSHSAIHKSTTGKFINPIIVILVSEKEDEFLDAILKSLRDASNQFSNDSSALIVCYLPEIDYFGELENDSGLVQLTHRFFAQHADRNIYGVTFCSDNKPYAETPSEVTLAMPSITFYNPNYDESFGPIVYFNPPDA